MLAERRLVLSLVSTNLSPNKENARYSSSLSRHYSAVAHTRKRCARTVASPNTRSYPPSRRTRRRGTCYRTSPPIAPDYDVQMAANNHHQQQAPSFPPTRHLLPRHLSRPKFRAIDLQVILAIDPVLEGIPLSYIQHTLIDIGPQLLHASCNATATPPSGKLPRELLLVCNDVSVDPPSHIIAAYSHTTPHTRVTLFPVHALVLATSCAHLPTLPRSKPDPLPTPGDTVTLPVVPLRIPSPSSFPALLSYIYTKRTDNLLAELLLPPQNASSIAQLVRAHAASMPVKALVAHVRKAHGLWSNAAALGVFDDNLFRTLEMAWEVLLSALAMSTGQSLDAGVGVDGELE